MQGITWTCCKAFPAVPVCGVIACNCVWFWFIDVKGNNLYDVYVCTCLSFRGNVINNGVSWTSRHKNFTQELFSATLNTVRLFESSTWPSHLVYHFWVQPSLAPTWPTSVTDVFCSLVESFPWSSPWLSFPVQFCLHQNKFKKAFLNSWKNTM